ncbi:hypothetical protein F8388_005263 [Cannabis sativa]|uniref:RCK N-terminal domain-containing protein n=1 Tax=Cannabis sativa TaxID=3483 RepID=A0A7J6EL99_CANSA|nr:hypothetical protein F8388_005263 [Cannabis sativa]
MSEMRRSSGGIISGPNKIDSPPVPKRSKTIAGDGPNRRPTTTQPFSAARTDLRVVTTHHNDDPPSNRDWFYPSFMVPQTTKRVAHKLPSSSDSRPPHRISAPSCKKSEKVKLVPNRSSSTESTQSKPWCSRITWIRKLKFLVKMKFYTNELNIHLHGRVEQLKAENASLRRNCSNRDSHSYESTKDNMQSEENDEIGILDYGNAEDRSVALYSVLITLVMPFLLCKYLDYLPHIMNFSKRTKKNKEEVPLKKRIAYTVDVCFSVYPYAKLLALLFATMFLIGFGGLALYAVNTNSFAEALWLSWTFVADSGNHADTEGIGPRIVSVSISSGGMLIFAMMLGLVSDAISEKVDSLRKGKSEVIERNHILILGWSDKLGSLLKQLAIANKSIGGGVVVVLAERDKEEMEMDISKLEFDFMGTSVICRSGSPLILADLKKVSVSKARAIIVLASNENADQSDARALRVVLSLTGVKEGLRGHVVVELSDLDNEPLVKLVGGELIETVVAHDVIGRLMIQCALQPGLAQNAEFYIKRWPQLDGLRFEDVLLSFPEAVPCGVKVASEGGKIILNPDDNYVLGEGDEILVIAEDDDTYSPGSIPEVRRGSCPKIFDPPKYPEKILFCGWRRDIDDMIMVLEAFLPPESELWMFNEVPEKDRERKLTDGGLDIAGLVNLKLVHREGNAVIKRHLENLPLETFDSVHESLEDSVVQSDSRSLATLLLIRDIQSKRLPSKDTKSTSWRFAGFSHSSWIREMQQASHKSIIISEILDSRTRNLVSVSRISDYVLSNELVKLCFYEIMIRARQRCEIVIGYRLANTECAIINPSEKSKPRKWSHDDVFVVIASED